MGLHHIKAPMTLRNDDVYYAISYRETFTITAAILAKSGVRVYVGGTLVVDSWDFSAGSVDAYGSVQMVKNNKVDFTVEFREDTGPAKLILYWESSSQTKEVIPASAMYFVHHVASSPYNVTITPGMEVECHHSRIECLLSVILIRLF